MAAGASQRLTQQILGILQILKKVTCNSSAGVKMKLKRRKPYLQCHVKLATSATMYSRYRSCLVHLMFLCVVKRRLLLVARASYKAISAVESLQRVSEAIRPILPKP